LEDLNPSLLRMTTPKDHPFELHLPAGTKDKFQSSIAAIPTDMRVWWRYHKVQPGDTLASIARTYRTTPKAIAEANHLDEDLVLTADSKLTIPIAPGKRAITEEATYALHATRYRVRKGDTVQKVADNFGVPPSMVRRWNHLKGDSLRGRSAIYVHLPVSPGAGQGEAVAHRSKSKQKKMVTAAKSPGDAVLHHKVKEGETLFSIASTYKTTVDALKRNNRNVAVLRPGMVLVIRP
jgi:membrane-bound lytic murein transglycosylase D